MHGITAQRTSTIAAALLLASGLAAPAAAGPADDDPQAKLTGVTFGGTGCNKDNTIVVLPANGRNVEITASALQARQQGAGGGTPDGPDDRPSVTCTIRMKLAWKAGYALRISAIPHAGSVDLASGATGDLKVTHHWPDLLPQDLVANPAFTGPVKEPLAFSSELPQPPYYSPCGVTTAQGDLGVKVQVNAKNAARDTDNALALENLEIKLEGRKC